MQIIKILIQQQSKSLIKDQIRMNIKFTSYLILIPIIIIKFTSYLILIPIIIMNTQQLNISSNKRFLQTETETETEDTLRAKIDAKIQARKAATQAYDQIFSNLSSAKIDLYTLQQQLLDAKVIAQNYYIYFYNTNLKCIGFLGSLDLLESTPSIPTQGCLKYPLALQSVDLVILRTQFQGFSQETQVANKLYQIQKQYVADSRGLQDIYSDLVTYFSQTGNTTLRDKFSQLFSVQYNNNFVEKQKQDGRNQTLQAAVGRDRQYAQIVKNKYAEMQAQAISCSKTLGTIRTQLNDEMAKANQLEAQVNDKKTFIQQSFNNLNSKINEIKTITAQLKALVDQYVGIFKTIQ